MILVNHPTPMVTQLVLNRPEKRNALTLDMLLELRRLLRVSTTSRVIVLSGAGGNFSSGADLRFFRGDERDTELDDAIANTTREILDSSTVIIAAIDGACIGAGVDLAIACDIRVGDPSTYFAIPAVRLGLLYRPASVARMVRSTSAAAVARLLLLGEQLAAPEALMLGLLTRLIPREPVLDPTLELASTLASYPQSALAATKTLLAELRSSPQIDFARLDAMRLELLSSPERKGAFKSLEC
jgi:enoyl-CoA hydratase/carnithine racemase